MNIKSVDIEKFSLFRDVKGLEFSPGINVFIGANATGKSHLLKLLYSIVRTAYTAEKDKTTDKKLIASRLQEKLNRVFRPADMQAHRLVHRMRGRNTASVGLQADTGNFNFRLTTSGNVYVDKQTLAQTEAPIFLPSREALAMYEGFIQAYDNRELSFDETYYDICVALSGSLAKGPRLRKARELAEPLEKILGGSVRLENDRFHVRSKDGTIEAHLLAEGLRKIASVVHLINNGSLLERGILFWDEPEANLNPKLTTQVCDALREMAASGVQIFLATHDYLISQEMSLAAEYQTIPQVPIRFFALSRTGEEKASVEAGETLADLQENPILEEFAAHYEREQKLFAQS
ncbi:MAG: AAA family ATPase [Verrucomicrobiota bacterium]